MLDNIEIGALLANSLYSVTRVLAGTFLAIILGIASGLFRSALPNLLKRSRMIKFLCEAPKFPPPIAWIPFVILFFGIGEISAYTIVFIGAFSPIFTSTFEGAESVPSAIRNCARSMEITGFRFLAKIIFPSALPQILTGIRVGVSMGWMSVIAAEMISGQSGLGYSIQLNRLNMQYDLMTIDMVCIGIIGFLLYEITVVLQKKLLPWHESRLN
ncbi:MAG: ABC transporter permease [Proteobacteria bacterium]|nr:ABC transporter permease [Pseudomonadota bacterium]MBU1738346.1 ABC transporter permease [Pseudomonadota bacterium]